ncbi:MAG: hypothetical protein ACREJS_10755 [Candidatus Rokuibacteriota bacterium]
MPRKESRPRKESGPFSASPVLPEVVKSPGPVLPFFPSRPRSSRSSSALIEGALGADELELEIIRQRLAQADARGPFVRHEDVLAWLEALSEGKPAPAPKATVNF